ncbi:alpha-amylase family protein [Actinomadura sp. 7K507]|uniref:alpha-amylase family protein n=1 Tax=Actinomadura sp. 7K507 TaxID=2530365 RepID=UPI001404529D|nr:alpha-amylase family protein [Actinomadura sp. 7K507]
MDQSQERSLSAYQRGWRHMLVDVEIPGWDEQFLSSFDPEVMADLYAKAGLSSVMFSCKNLSGLCFWPTEVGPMHPRVAGRDIIGETAEALRARGIASCAYYSVIFDNWAFEQDPGWRFEPVQGWRRQGSAWDRHGVCCPNSPGYREYVGAQIDDLYGRYEFECAFCDMTFWPDVCGCRHCRARYRTEVGAEFPDTIDWTSVEWCTFQAARERWIDEFTGFVSERMRRAQPGIAVYHNFSLAPAHWRLGIPFSITDHCDFLGGDHYGDEVEQLVVTKLRNTLSWSRPVDYMSFVTADAGEHVRLKTAEYMRAQVLSAAAESSAFMFLDAVDPVGTVNARSYDLVGTAFESMAEFEPFLGGEPIEDVAVYYSGDSKMDFAENGHSLSDPAPMRDDYPHRHAVRGACRMLQRAHIPFGVITRRQLADLGRYRVLVLADIARIDESEVDAIREYVRRGGRVYASRYTSLVETRGLRHEDFMLADMFGAHLDREEAGVVAYAKPATAEFRAWADPQAYLSVDPAPGALNGGILRLRADDDAHVLATLSLPYAHPHVGDVSDRNWASMHSSPPWEDTPLPVILERQFGLGRVIYSAFNIERDEADVNDRTFAGLIRRLRGEQWTLQCETHPAITVSAFRHPGDNAIRVSLLNTPPALVADATLRLRAPEGKRFTELEQVPQRSKVPFSTEPDGTLECTIKSLPELTMLLAHCT